MASIEVIKTSETHGVSETHTQVAMAETDSISSMTCPVDGGWNYAMSWVGDAMSVTAMAEPMTIGGRGLMKNGRHEMRSSMKTS